MAADIYLEDDKQLKMAGGHRNGGGKWKTEEQEHPNYWWDEWNWSGFCSGIRT